MNASGPVSFDGVTMRVKPDGTATLIQKLSAIAEVPFDMRLYPFDSQHLDATFELLGFGHDEVQLQLLTDVPDKRHIHVPQWRQTAMTQEISQRAAPYAGAAGVSSALVVAIELQREPFFVLRLVILPLLVIVLLSFAVFWMDKASLGDRLSVSFIGILTAVAYQMVITDSLPPISYITWTHAFLSMSFIMMAATVVINLVVAVTDRSGRRDAGDRIDRHCRWVFPLAYFTLILATIIVARFFL
ncbi:MAG: hypothetical protein HC809_00330 [Gammaproteobacteria bacterium]|nr:hypothetical protein [Gammaproteobacteria bacterium]